jgi:ATP-dependent DNA ligase
MPVRQICPRTKQDAGARLTAAKMGEGRWLRPVLVGQFEFVEWTGENHLRQTRFIALREDKKATDVKRE